MLTSARGISPDDNFDIDWITAESLPLQEKELKHACMMPHSANQRPKPYCDGMWKPAQLFGFILGIFLAVLVKLVQPYTCYPEANDMMSITLLCGAFWVFEVMPIYATALIPAVLMPAFKITSAANAGQAYWQPIHLLVIGVYLVDIAMTMVPLPKRIMLNLLLSLKTFQPSLVLWCFMFVTWMSSIFINNIAVVLMITPFAANLICSTEEQVQQGLFSEQDSESDSAESDIDIATEIGNFSDAVMLGIAASANIGGMFALTGCIQNEVLMGIPDISEAVDYARWTGVAGPVSAAGLPVAYFVIYMKYLRNSKLKGGSLDVVKKEREELIRTVGPVSRDEILIAVVLGVQVLALLLKRIVMETVLGRPPSQEWVGDATVAVTCALTLFLLPSKLHPGQPILKWRDVQDNLNIGLLLLMGGGFAIAYGFTESGLNIELAHHMSSRHVYFSGMQFFFYVLILGACTTTVFSSFASVATLLPYLGSLALKKFVHPVVFLVPATVGCSFAFMLPAAAAPNLIVMAKSQDFAKPLRTKDFLQTGFPITVAMILVATVVISVTIVPTFHTDEPFPKWACDHVMCLWAQVPGVARGQYVSEQACAVLASGDGASCLLWNGTILPTAPMFADEGWMEV